MIFFYLKALHIIFIVTWFSGLFYIVRIFVYQTESTILDNPEKSILIKEYKRNARRLWYAITWPSAILTLILGASLVIRTPTLLSQSFMQIKLVLVALLYFYQFYFHKIFNELQNDVYKNSAFQLRIWNEISSILLVGIVFIIVLKNGLSLVWGLLGLVLLSVIIIISIIVYKRIREKK